MMSKEPALTVGAITAAFTAAIGLAVAFGVDLSQDQQDALLGALAAFVPLILAMSATIRQTVYSPNSVEQKVEAAKAGDEVEVPGA